MKIYDLYQYGNSGIQNGLKVEDAGVKTDALSTGDILEGVVTSMNNSTKVAFEQLNNKEISFPKESVKDAYVGEKRRFEVVEASADKLVLRDLGGIAEEVMAKGVLSAKVDMNMTQMVEDFRETTGEKEEEDTDSIKRLSEDDYRDLQAEGFSIEDYKAERLIRALARIKANRVARDESIDAQSENIRNNRESIKKQAVKSAVDKYVTNRDIADMLLQSDLPATEENIRSIINSVNMGSQASGMTGNSVAYIIGNGLEPTVSNIYKSIYIGNSRQTELGVEAWQALEPSVKKIVEEAAVNCNPSAEPADVQDAKWLIEHDIPLTGEALVYKKELEDLRSNPRQEREIAEAAVRALERGERAEDAMLIASHEAALYKGQSLADSLDYSSEDSEESEVRRLSIEQLSSRIRLSEIRLSMSLGTGAIPNAKGIEIDTEAMQQELDRLRNELRLCYEELGREIGIEEAKLGEAASMAAGVTEAVEEVAASPVTLYSVTYSQRTMITLQNLAVEAAKLRSGAAEQRLAAGRYDASATEIRKDLGDSIDKAFGNVDSLLTGLDLELSEANRRAVRILGYNSLEISHENIENIKYFDARVTTMINGLKPVMVMSMIKRGFNPLEREVDEINNEITQIEKEEGVSAEERFSEFLVRLEKSESLPEETRAAFIGIYRLLYQIEKNDGAAIGAAVASGKKLTLKNLLTEARTRNNSGIDVNIDDDTQQVRTSFTNSITEQISSGFDSEFGEQISYNLQLARQAAKETEPAVWEEALSGENTEELTLEQVAEKLQYADKYISDDNAALSAAAVRTVMTSSGFSRKLLKNLGVDDSVRNLAALERDGEELAIPFESAESLLETVGDENRLKGYFEAEAQKEKENTEQEFLGNIAIISRGAELKEELDKYGLLNQMAGREHFRMKLDGDTPAKINLTIIHSTAGAGTVSLEVSTDSYHVKADMSITIYNEEQEAQSQNVQEGKLFGRITCDGAEELEAIRIPFEAFVSAMQDEGYDTTGLQTGVDKLNFELYMSRLGELKRRADLQVAEPERKSQKTSTIRLYNVAKQFIAKFM